MSNPNQGGYGNVNHGVTQITNPGPNNSYNFSGQDNIVGNSNVHGHVGNIAGGNINPVNSENQNKNVEKK